MLYLREDHMFEDATKRADNVAHASTDGGRDGMHADDDRVHPIADGVVAKIEGPGTRVRLDELGDVLHLIVDVPQRPEYVELVIG
ncbi:hypothetical protein DEJ31_07300 [Curtobacterium sp. MCPF17_031]|nr:hypothetical protein DEJ31_07300 [Curtobacterium sp. MCPF17_031]